MHKTKMKLSPPMLDPVLLKHQLALRACTQCPDMVGPVITGHATRSPILLVGQAPGAREGGLGKPFAWTAGKTLFQWFSSIGLEEENFRNNVYMAAVCRCFPGKNPNGGDRVPSVQEIRNCATWLSEEIALLRPKLIVPVGKLAIMQFSPVKKLDEIIGKKRSIIAFGHTADLIALPHPSGASTWHRVEPGRQLLAKALKLLSKHASWQEILKNPANQP